MDEALELIRMDSEGPVPPPSPNKPSEERFLESIYSLVRWFRRNNIAPEDVHIEIKFTNPHAYNWGTYALGVESLRDHWEQGFDMHKPTEFTVMGMRLSVKV